MSRVEVGEELNWFELHLTIVVICGGIMIACLLKMVEGGQPRNLPDLEGVYSVDILLAELVFGGVGGNRHIVLSH